MTWVRSSACSCGDCVEILQFPNGWVHVRDSKHPEQEPLRFDRDEWAAFVDGIKTGQFDTNPTGGVDATVFPTVALDAVREAPAKRWTYTPTEETT